MFIELTAMSEKPKTIWVNLALVAGIRRETDLANPRTILFYSERDFFVCRESPEVILAAMQLLFETKYAALKAASGTEAS